jgi:hypothetical protein
MNRTSATMIAVLALLCVGLAVNTVVRATSSARPVDSEGLADAAMARDAPEEGEPLPLEDVAFEAIDVPAGAAPLGCAGEWLNEDEDLGPLSRITISKNDSGFAIQPWSASKQGEKPYGPAREFECESNPVEVTWDAGFAQQRMRLAVMPDGLLRVDRLAECVNHQCGTPHQPTTEYFLKATPGDLAAHEQAIKGAVVQAELDCLPEVPGGG